MAGYEVVKVATAPDGGVDLDDLRANADETVACLMLTNPNTLGLFDRNIREIAEITHGVGGTLYYDGANLNAIMGHSRPGDMGFDIVHLNLHKSFSQPHGGAGRAPGRSRSPTGSHPSFRCRGSSAEMIRLNNAKTSPSAQRARTARLPRSTSTTRARSRSAACAGSRATSGVFVRSHAYITSLGADGLTEASETAVLNANYLLARLRAGAPASTCGWRSESVVCTSSSSPAAPPPRGSR